MENTPEDDKEFGEFMNEILTEGISDSKMNGVQILNKIADKQTLSFDYTSKTGSHKVQVSKMNSVIFQYFYLLLNSHLPKINARLKCL